MSCSNVFEEDMDKASSCQSKELLSLRWNNHLLAFRTLLSTVKEKSCFSDVTVACEGELFAVHKLVLSSCSEYFSSILRATLCPQPVIVLKDISCKDFHALLNYMYLGEVNILREELSSFLNASESLGIKGLSMSDVGGESNSSFERTTESHSTDPADDLLKPCQENEDTPLQTSPNTLKGNADNSNTDKSIIDNSDTDDMNTGNGNPDISNTDNNDTAISNTANCNIDISNKDIYSDSNCTVLSTINEMKQKRKIFGSEVSVCNSAQFNEGMNCNEELNSSKKMKMSMENNTNADDSENTLEECTLNEFYEDDTFDIMPQVCVNIKEEPEALLSDRPAVVPAAGQRSPTTEQLPLENESSDSASHSQQYGNRTIGLAEIITEALNGGDRDTDTSHYLGSLECEDLSVMSKDKSGDGEVCLLQLEPRSVHKQSPDAHHEQVQVSQQQQGQVAHQHQMQCHQEQRVSSDLKNRPNLICLTDSVKNVKAKSCFGVKQSCSGIAIASKPIIVGEPLSEVSGVGNMTCGGLLAAGDWRDASSRMYVPAGTVTFSQQPSIVCCYCAKEFAFASDLRRHMRSHTGEKPFQCPLCSFKTSQRYNLERHKKIHETKA